MDVSPAVLQVAVERPSKDENGQPVHDLLDITPEGIRVPDRPREPDDLLAENIRRIFQERGIDFFDKHPDLGGLRIDDDPSSHTTVNTDEEDPTTDEEAVGSQAMTIEQLNKMRGELLQQLFVAHGELSLAQELLGSLLPARVLSQLAQSAQPGLITATTEQRTAALTATVVTGQPEIVPVQAYNAQLVVSGKDEGLRGAASVLRTAAADVERGQAADEQYWVDALKLRRANWGLMPAPLPFGTANIRAPDRPATDFLVSCGLEEAPLALRRRAVGRLSTQHGASTRVEFRHLQNTHLRVTLAITNMDDGSIQEACSAWLNTGEEDTNPLEASIRAAQREIIDHEVFTALVQEAGTLPTASASVSEQLIIIEAAQGTELRFELISRDTDPGIFARGPEPIAARCDLIHATLQLLLVRAHARAKTRRWAAAGSQSAETRAARGTPPPILRPLIDLIQYETFCERVRAEVNRVSHALASADIRARVRFSGLGDSSASVLRMVSDVDDGGRIGGEVVLRIDRRHTIRLGLLAPSSLVAHLSHATLPIASIPQLSQLLAEEAERCLLERIRELGQERSENGTWFVDPLAGCAFGRWDGGVQSFRVSLSQGSVHCTVFRVIREQHQRTATYDASAATHPGALFDWVLQQVNGALTGDVDA